MIYVDEIHTRCAHLNEQVLRTRLRAREVDRLQRLGSTGLTNFDGLHYSVFALRAGLPRPHLTIQNE